MTRRELTVDQQALVDSNATRPIVIAEVAHSGASEYLSATGRVVYNGQVYKAGGFNLGGIRNSESASLSLPFTPARVQEVGAGVWRGGVCKIWAILADPTVEAEYDETDSFLLLAGEISSSKYVSGRIQVQAKHVFAGTKVSPKHTYNRVVANPPAAGTSITWEGETIVLSSRR